MKRVSFAVLVASLIMGLSSIPAASAGPTTPGPRYHELACSLDAQAPQVLTGPRRLVGRAVTQCANSGDNISRIVVWTALQWFCCTETQIQTIALNKVTRTDVASGTTLRTKAVRACPPTDTAFAYLFRTKVTVRVYDSYGDLRLKKVDFAPAGGQFVQRTCGDADGF